MVSQASITNRYKGTNHKEIYILSCMVTFLLGFSYYFWNYGFYERSQICENWLLALWCPSVRPLGTSWLQRDWFWWMLVIEIVSKNLSKILKFIQIRQKNTLHETCIYLWKYLDDLPKMKNFQVELCRNWKHT